MGTFVLAKVDRSTLIRRIPGRDIEPSIQVGPDLTITFDSHGMAEDQAAAIDRFIAALGDLHEHLAAAGERRYVELEAYHDAAHDDDCPCLVAAARAYLVPIVGEPLRDEPAAAAHAAL